MYLALEQYVRAESVEQCLDLLGADGSAAIAGGTELNVYGHERVVRLVDLQELPLRGIDTAAGRARVGALVTLSQLVRAELGPGLAALAQAARGENNISTRNRSTVGGRIARARRADGRLATALLALGADVEVAGASGRETLSMADYLARAAGGSPLLVCAVSAATDARASGYAAFAGTVMESPIADAALCIAADGAVRLASGGYGAAGGVVALPETAKVVAAIAAGEASDAWRPRVADAARAELPAFADDRGSAEYRRELAITLLTRLVDTARGDTDGGEGGAR